MAEAAAAACCAIGNSILEVGNACGPHGEQDDEQVFVQKVVPETDTLFVRLASNGKRICVIRSVDGTTITSFCVHECEGSSRVGSRHGCQMAIARFFERMCLALRASRTMAPLRYAAKFDPFLSLDFASTHALHPGTIQGKEGTKFCHLATLAPGPGGSSSRGTPRGPFRCGT